MVGCPTPGGAGGVEFWEDGRRREGPAVVGEGGTGVRKCEQVGNKNQGETRRRTLQAQLKWRTDAQCFKKIAFCR